MTCSDCAARLESRIWSLPLVTDVAVSALTHKVTNVRYIIILGFSKSYKLCIYRYEELEYIRIIDFLVRWICGVRLMPIALDL